MNKPIELKLSWWCACNKPTLSKGSKFRIGGSVYPKCMGCGKVMLKQKRRVQ